MNLGCKYLITIIKSKFEFTKQGWHKKKPRFYWV